MTSKDVEDVLARISALDDVHGDPQLRAVRTALLLEDFFGITLSDAEIDPVELGDPTVIRQLLARHGVRD